MGLHEDGWTTINLFGYMWECPNYLSFEKKKDLLILFVTGGTRKAITMIMKLFIRMDTFLYTTDLEKDCVLEDFIEFDHGFDIYAQQFFKDEKVV